MAEELESTTATVENSTDTDEVATGDASTAGATVASEEAAPREASQDTDRGPATGGDRASSDRSYYGNAGGQPELNDALSQRTESTEPLKDVEGGRAYEIIYIAQIGDAEANDATTVALRAFVDGAAGAVDNVRASEVRRLAYPIKGEVDGIYTVVNVRIAPDHLPELDRFFKLEESVIRHMIIKEV